MPVISTTKKKHHPVIEETKVKYCQGEAAPSKLQQDEEPKLIQFNRSYARLQEVSFVLSDVISAMDGQPNTQPEYNEDFFSMSNVLTSYPSTMDSIINDILDKISVLRSRVF